MRKLKILLTLLLVLQFDLIAQNGHNQGLFSSRNVQTESRNNRDHGDNGEEPDPGGGQGVPIGSGLPVLAGLSLGYACIRRNRKKDN